MNKDPEEEAAAAAEHDERLNRINTELRERGLRPLPGVGRTDLEQTAFLDIAKVDTEGRGPKCDVVFEARTKRGVERPWVVTMNKEGGISDGCTIIPFVNGTYIALITLWREGIGQLSTELPRGAGERGDAQPIQGPIGTPHDPGNPPSLQTALREFGEEVTNDCHITDTCYMGWACENTSACNVAPDVILLEITLTPEAMQTLSMREEEPITFLEVADAYQVPPITPDQHSLTALFLARPYFAKLGLL